MATLKKILKKKFAFKPAAYNPNDIVAIPTSVYGGLRKPGKCLGLHIHERYSEFGHTPGRLVWTVELDALEVKKLIKSLILTQSPSDMDRLIESAKKERSKRGRR